MQLRRAFASFLQRMAAATPATGAAEDGVALGVAGGRGDAAPSGEGAAANVWRPRDGAAAAAAGRGRPSASGAAVGATSEAALRRTRAAMAREISRLSAVSETVERDSTVIEASRSRHLEYAGAVNDTYHRLWAQQVRALE